MVPTKLLYEMLMYIFFHCQLQTVCFPKYQSFYGVSVWLLIHVVGVECISLSSSISSEDGWVMACPNITITITCTASQIPAMTWLEQGRQIDVFLVHHYDSEETRVIHDDPYTLTLVAVDNITHNGEVGDFTSTLEVMVDDIENGTNIECAAPDNTDHIIIFRKSEFFSP